MKPIIFCIEDDYVTNIYNEIVFSKIEGVKEVRVFGDSIKALFEIKAAEQKPHIIFLDINMPKMNGWEVVKNIEESPYDFLANPYYVFMLTTSLSQVDRKKSDESPLVKGFIEKPLTKEKIQEILTSYHQEK